MKEDIDIKNLKTWWQEFTAKKDPEDYTKQELGKMYDRDMRDLNIIWLLLFVAAITSTYAMSASLHEAACADHLYKELERLGYFSEQYSLSLIQLDVDKDIIFMTDEVYYPQNGDNKEK